MPEDKRKSPVGPKLIHDIQHAIGEAANPIDVLGAICVIVANAAIQAGMDEDDFAGFARGAFQAVLRLSRHRKG